MQLHDLFLPHYCIVTDHSVWSSAVVTYLPQGSKTSQCMNKSLVYLKEVSDLKQVRCISNQWLWFGEINHVAGHVAAMSSMSS